MAPARPVSGTWLGGLALALLALWGVAAALGTGWPAARALLSIKEGPVEHLTHAVLLGAAVWHGVRWRHGGAGASRTHALLALVCAMYLLEEIDYGQVYVGFATPSWLLPFTGRSDECNVHNTALVDALVMAAAAMYFVVFPGVLQLGRGRRWLARLGVRLPHVGYGALFFGVLVASYLGERLPGAPFDADELMDLSIAAMLLQLAIAPRWTAVAPAVGEA